MKNLMLVALAAIVLSFPASASAAKGGTDRPLKLTSSGTIVADLATGAFSSEETDLTSHLGTTHTVGSGMLTPTGPTTFDFSGSITKTAANGDKLFLILTGTATTDPATGTGLSESHETITGGTGRFEGASGTLLGTTTSTLVSTMGAQVTFAFSGSATGTISY